MNAASVSGWACGACGKTHRFRPAAILCCAEKPYFLDEYRCTECGEEHDDWRHAEACCLPEDEAEAILNMPMPAELEAAGQMRLVP